MNALADDGFVLLAGPLAGSEHGRLRVLLIVRAEAEAEAEIHRRLADDPWARTKQLETVRVEPWNVFVGAERVASAFAAAR